MNAELIKKLREVIKLCKKENITGFGESVAGYYCTFNYSPKPINICKKCGKEIA